MESLYRSLLFGLPAPLSTYSSIDTFSYAVYNFSTLKPITYGVKCIRLAEVPQLQKGKKPK